MTATPVNHTKLFLAGVAATIAMAGPAVLIAGWGTAHADPQTLLDLVNDKRVENNCQPLTMNDKLVAAAERHVDDIAATGSMSHDGSDKSTELTRIQSAGYAPLRGWAENIYRGTTESAAVNAWMNSPTHRRQMLDCSYTDVGFAEASGGAQTYYVGNFARH